MLLPFSLFHPHSLSGGFPCGTRNFLFAFAPADAFQFRLCKPPPSSHKLCAASMWSELYGRSQSLRCGYCPSLNGFLSPSEPLMQHSSALPQCFAKTIHHFTWFKWKVSLPASFRPTDTLQLTSTHGPRGLFLRDSFLNFWLSACFPLLCISFASFPFCPCCLRWAPSFFFFSFNSLWRQLLFLLAVPCWGELGFLFADPPTQPSLSLRHNGTGFLSFSDGVALRLSSSFHLYSDHKIFFERDRTPHRGAFPGRRDLL